MEKSDTSGIEFSLVDVILPLAEMWRTLLLLPAVVGILVYTLFLFYPPNETFSSLVHLPPERIAVLMEGEDLVPKMAAAREAMDLKSAQYIIDRVTVASTKDDESRVSLTLPRGEGAEEFLNVVVVVLEPHAASYLETEKTELSALISQYQRTLAALHVAEIKLTEALEKTQKENPDDVKTIAEHTDSLFSVASALWNTDSLSKAKQLQADDLISASAAGTVARETRGPMFSALAAGGVFFLVLVYIYIRQEILYALSYESGRRKVSQITRSLKIFRMKR